MAHRTSSRWQQSPKTSGAWQSCSHTRRHLLIPISHRPSSEISGQPRPTFAGEPERHHTDFCSTIGTIRKNERARCMSGSAPKAATVTLPPALQRCAMCGRLPAGKGFLHVRGWSVQPCVRPVCAAHMTAGHNALRVSGPGHKLAFEDAWHIVGCPDRRTDRLCITCCSPSQPSHHTGSPSVISITPPVRRVPCNARP